MNKIYDLKEQFIPIRYGGNRIIISYDYQILEDGINSIWYEVYFYNNLHGQIGFDEIKEAILADINAQTDEKILSGFIWNDKPVWLSSENQFNFKAAYDLAVQTQGQNLPVKFKLGENEEGEPVYHTFEDMTEFTDFYTKAIAFINQCLNEGWERKDAIDWSDYETK